MVVFSHLPWLAFIFYISRIPPTEQENSHWGHLYPPQGQADRDRLWLSQGSEPLTCLAVHMTSNLTPSCEYFSKFITSLFKCKEISFPIRVVTVISAHHKHLTHKTGHQLVRRLPVFVNFSSAFLVVHQRQRLCVCVCMSAGRECVLWEFVATPSG